MTDDELIGFFRAVSADIAQLRGEMQARFEKIETRLESIEREQRSFRQRFDRPTSVIYESRADLSELQDRVDALEAKPQ